MAKFLPVASALTLLFALGCLVAARASSYPTVVVELTDESFEHDTQASSGQTTGVWAVLFTDSTVKRYERALLAVEELAKDDEKELIYAQVDVARSIKLAKRFGDFVFLPCILLFRDRQMYVFDKSFDRMDIAQEIQDFVTVGYVNSNPLDVPEPRDRKMNLEAFESNQQMDMKNVGWAVLLIVGGLLFQTWAILNKDKFKPEPGQGKNTEKKDKGEAAQGKKKEAGPKKKDAAQGEEKEEGKEGPSKAAVGGKKEAAADAKATPGKGKGKAKAT